MSKAAPKLSATFPAPKSTKEPRKAGADVVKVFARIRSLQQHELVAGADKSAHELRVAGDSIFAGEKQFCFEMCFSSLQGQEQRAAQSEVYAHVGPPLLDASLSGFHSCLLAYGQTGSGKTFTMSGIESADGLDDGVIPRLISELFQRIATKQEEARADGRIMSFRLLVRYFEIYCEKAYDLLAKGQEVHIRTTDVIEGISEHLATTKDGVMRLFRRGNAIRTTAATAKNNRSSRSHAILQLKLHQDVATVAAKEDSVHHESLESTVNLVDLAGSERCTEDTASATDRFREMTNINLSLLTLRRVIHLLHDNSSNKPPLRESLLTFVLANCFGGNSKTSLVVTLSPNVDDYKDTVSTLEFGNTARKVVNHAVVNVDKSTLLLRSMSDEIARLKGILAERTTSLPVEPPAPLQANDRYSIGIMTCEDEIEEQLEHATSVFRAMQRRSIEQAQTNFEFIADIEAKEVQICALQKMVETLNAKLTRSVSDFLKSRPEMQKLQASLAEPLRKTAGCPKCQSFQTESFVTAIHNAALEQAMAAANIQQEETFIENEELQRKLESANAHIDELRAQIVVLEDKTMIVAEQKKVIEDMAAQLEKYVQERARLTLDNYQLESRLSNPSLVDVTALGFESVEGLRKALASVGSPLPI